MTKKNRGELVFILAIALMISSFTAVFVDANLQRDHTDIIYVPEITERSDTYPFEDHYPSVQELYDWYDDLVDEFPDLVSKIHIGNSWQGRDLWVLEITSEEDVRVEEKPEILIDGALHAREWSSTQVACYLLWRLVTEYESNETIYWLLNNRIIYIMPMVNPDGYIFDGDGNYGSQRDWRKNRNDSTPTSAIGVDLNRNWDINWGFGSNDPGSITYRGGAPFSEYETKYLRNFMMSRNIQSYQNIHSFHGSLLIPWSYATSPSPHDSWYRGMAEHMTSMTSRMGDENNNYLYGQAGQLIGYSAPGTANDWAYYALGAHGLCYELETGGYGFYPPPEYIMTINKDVDNSLIYQCRIADTDLGDGTNHLFPPVPYIVYGTVEDTSGNPVIDMEVTFENIDTGETMLIETDNNGYYEFNYGNLVEYGYTLTDTFTVSSWTATTEYTIGEEWGRRIDMEVDMVGEPPEITIISPDGGEVWTALTEEDIVWTTTENDDHIESIDLWYSIDSGASWRSIASDLEDTGDHTWTIPNDNSAQCLVRGRVTDDQGRWTEDVSDGYFTIMGFPPSPPDNKEVDHYELGEILDNGNFIGDYEPWVLERLQTGGESRWDSQGHDEGGAIYVIAEQIGSSGTKVEEAYWEQTFDPVSDELILSGSYRRRLSREDQHFDHIDDAVVEISVHDTATGWETILINEDRLFGDTGWIDFETAIYEPTGSVDAVRARMHVTARTRIIGIHAKGELWMDGISLLSEIHEGGAHNRISWDASPDDPDEVSHYNIYRSESYDGPWDESAFINSVNADGSEDYRYIDENKGAADETYWWYVVRGVGVNGLEEENDDIVREPGASYNTFDIPLTLDASSDDWNFVSFNLIPESASLEAILSDIDGSYDRVMYYDASTGQWRSYMPGRDGRFNYLNTWDHRMGLWIKVNSGATLTVEGTLPTTTEVTLYPGWNMVGLPSRDPGNHGLPTEVDRVGYFDASASGNLAYSYTPSTFVFEPGKGYWVHNPTSTTLTWTVDY